MTLASSKPSQQPRELAAGHTGLPEVSILLLSTLSLVLPWKAGAKEIQARTTLV